MNDSPTKKDKKILREAINVGIEKDKVAAITAMGELVDKWRVNEIDFQTTYSELYSTLHKFDKIIARRYDGVTGSNYMGLVAQLFAIGHLTEEHLDGLSEDVLNRILLFKQLSDKN